MTESEQLLGMISEMRTLAASVRTRKVERAITLEDVGKSKVIFDTYIGLKAVTFVHEEMKKSVPARASNSRRSRRLLRVSCGSEIIAVTFNAVAKGPCSR